MIVTNKRICGGKARIKGTRLTVSGIFSMLASGNTVEDIVRISNKHYKSSITEQDILDAINYGIKKLSL